MLTGPTAFHAIAVRLRDAVRVSLATSATGAPQRVVVMPGAIAWDNCETCGLLAVTVQRVYLADVFPEPRISRDLPCDPAFEIADIIVQVIRCAPQPQGNDVSPSVAALEASALTTTSDAHLTLVGALCELRAMVDADDIVDYVIGEQLITGPAGACVGSQLTVTVGLDL